MKLEEEIKQNKFKDEYHKLGVNIIYTGNWLSAGHSKYLRKYGITAEQFNILRILRGQFPKPATVNLIMERMLNKMSNVSRLVEKLRLKGFVRRKINQRDRRACDVVITQKGMVLTQELMIAEKEMVRLLSGISREEAKKINFLLDKLRG